MFATAFWHHFHDRSLDYPKEPTPSLLHPAHSSWDKKVTSAKPVRIKIATQLHWLEGRKEWDNVRDRDFKSMYGLIVRKNKKIKSTCKQLKRGISRQQRDVMNQNETIILFKIGRRDRPTVKASKQSCLWIFYERYQRGRGFWSRFTNFLGVRGWRRYVLCVLDNVVWRWNTRPLAYLLCNIHSHRCGRCRAVVSNLTESQSYFLDTG